MGAFSLATDHRASKTSDKSAPMVDYLQQGRRLTPFTDTTAAAALHVVGQLPY